MCALIFVSCSKSMSSIASHPRPIDSITVHLSFYSRLHFYFCLFLFLFAVRGPLTVVASPGAEHRLRTRRLSGHGSRAQPRLACGILADRGMNPCPLHRQADSQSLHHQGSPKSTLLKKIFSAPVPAGSSCLPTSSSRQYWALFFRLVAFILGLPASLS